MKQVTVNKLKGTERKCRSGGGCKTTMSFRIASDLAVFVDVITID